MRNQRSVLSLCLACFIGIFLGCAEEGPPGGKVCGIFVEGVLWPDIDISRYERVAFDGSILFVPAINQGILQFKNVQPRQQTDYWEIRHTDNPEEAIRLNTVKIGTKCGSATDKERCQSEFDAMRLPSRINNDLPRFYGSLFFYIASNRGDENRIVYTREEILEFLGTIDSKEEAVLLVTKDGFYNNSKDSSDRSIHGHGPYGAMRNVDSEYEFITYRDNDRVSGQKRYLLRVLPSGEIRILREERTHYVECIET